MSKEESIQSSERDRAPRFLNFWIRHWWWWWWWLYSGVCMWVCMWVGGGGVTMPLP